MKYTRYIFLLLCAAFVQIAVAQQLPYISQFSESRSIWNPAATAYDHYIHTDLHMRQQWLGFDGAPTSGYLSAGYPLLDYNMSVGLGLTFDKTGPVQKVGAEVNYAYKLRNIFTRDAQLSIGIGAGIQQYSFDPSNAVVRDAEDPLVGTGKASSMFPSVKAGFFFISNPKKYDGGNVFYMGGSFTQVYAGDILTDGINQKRVRHMFFEVGTVIQGRNSFIEPSLMFNNASPELATLVASVRYEMRDAFWAGIGYSTASDMSIQAGFILPEMGGQYGQLRLGALANYGIHNQANEFGLGFEALVSYLYDLD